MPLYGQSFTLNDPLVNGLNAPARTGGTAGPFTRARGFLAYYEVGLLTDFSGHLLLSGISQQFYMLKSFSLDY